MDKDVIDSGSGAPKPLAHHTDVVRAPPLEIRIGRFYYWRQATDSVDPPVIAWDLTDVQTMPAALLVHLIKEGLRLQPRFESLGNGIGIRIEDVRLVQEETQRGLRMLGTLKDVASIIALEAIESVVHNDTEQKAPYALTVVHQQVINSRLLGES
jgi:hypothetical protein